MMAKEDEKDFKTADKAAAGKEVTVRTEQTKTDAPKEKPDEVKAKAPANQAAVEAAAGKEVTVKTEQLKTDIEKEQPAGEKAKAPAQKTEDKAAEGKEAAAEKKEPAKGGSSDKLPSGDKANTPVSKTEAKAKKSKGSFARKMKGVKDAASMIGEKIAEAAKDVSIKSDNLEDAIASGLQDMKKDIHRVAVKIAEKTKE